MKKINFRKKVNAILLIVIFLISLVGVYGQLADNSDLDEAYKDYKEPTSPDTKFDDLKQGFESQQASSDNFALMAGSDKGKEYIKTEQKALDKFGELTKLHPDDAGALIKSWEGPKSANNPFTGSPEDNKRLEEFKKKYREAFKDDKNTLGSQVTDVSGHIEIMSGKKVAIDSGDKRVLSLDGKDIQLMSTSGQATLIHFDQLGDGSNIRIDYDAKKGQQLVLTEGSINLKGQNYVVADKPGNQLAYFSQKGRDVIEMKGTIENFAGATRITPTQIPQGGVVQILYYKDTPERDKINTFYEGAPIKYDSLSEVPGLRTHTQQFKGTFIAGSAGSFDPKNPDIIITDYSSNRYGQSIENSQVNYHSNTIDLYGAATIESKNLAKDRGYILAGSLPKFDEFGKPETDKKGNVVYNSAYVQNDREKGDILGRRSHADLQVYFEDKNSGKPTFYSKGNVRGEGLRVFDLGGGGVKLNYDSSSDKGSVISLKVPDKSIMKNLYHTFADRDNLASQGDGHVLTTMKTNNGMEIAAYNRPPTANELMDNQAKALSATGPASAAFFNGGPVKYTQGDTTKEVYAQYSNIGSGDITYRPDVDQWDGKTVEFTQGIFTEGKASGEVVATAQMRGGKRDADITVSEARVKPAEWYSFTMDIVQASGVGFVPATLLRHAGSVAEAPFGGGYRMTSYTSDIMGKKTETGKMVLTSAPYIGGGFGDNPVQPGEITRSLFPINPYVDMALTAAGYGGASDVTFTRGTDPTQPSVGERLGLGMQALGSWRAIPAINNLGAFGDADYYMPWSQDEITAVKKKDVSLPVTITKDPLPATGVPPVVAKPQESQSPSSAAAVTKQLADSVSARADAPAFYVTSVPSPYRPVDLADAAPGDMVTASGSEYLKMGEDNWVKKYDERVILNDDGLSNLNPYNHIPKVSTPYAGGQPQVVQPSTATTPTSPVPSTSGNSLSDGDTYESEYAGTIHIKDGKAYTVAEDGSDMMTDSFPEPKSKPAEISEDAIWNAQIGIYASSDGTTWNIYGVKTSDEPNADGSQEGLDSQWANFKQNLGDWADQLKTSFDQYYQATTNLPPGMKLTGMGGGYLGEDLQLEDEKQNTYYADLNEGLIFDKDRIPVGTVTQDQDGNNEYSFWPAENVISPPAPEPKYFKLGLAGPDGITYYKQYIIDGFDAAGNPTSVIDPDTGQSLNLVRMPQSGKYNLPDGTTLGGMDEISGGSQPVVVQPIASESDPGAYLTASTQPDPATIQPSGNIPASQPSKFVILNDKVYKLEGKSKLTETGYTIGDRDYDSFFYPIYYNNQRVGSLQRSGANSEQGATIILFEGKSINSDLGVASLSYDDKKKTGSSSNAGIESSTTFIDNDGRLYSGSQDGKISRSEVYIKPDGNNYVVRKGNENLWGWFDETEQTVTPNDFEYEVTEIMGKYFTKAKSGLVLAEGNIRGYTYYGGTRTSTYKLDSGPLVLNTPYDKWQYYTDAGFSGGGYYISPRGYSKISVNDAVKRGMGTKIAQVQEPSSEPLPEPLPLPEPKLTTTTNAEDGVTGGGSARIILPESDAPLPADSSTDDKGTANPPASDVTTGDNQVSTPSDTIPQDSQIAEAAQISAETYKPTTSQGSMVRSILVESIYPTDYFSMMEYPGQNGEKRVLVLQTGASDSKDYVAIIVYDKDNKPVRLEYPVYDTTRSQSLVGMSAAVQVQLFKSRFSAYAVSHIN